MDDLNTIKTIKINAKEIQKALEYIFEDPPTEKKIYFILGTITSTASVIEQFANQLEKKIGEKMKESVIKGVGETDD